MKVDFILVYKLDRWARNQSDFFAIKAILTKHGTNLLSVTEQVDDSPTGKFLEGIFSGLAQLDNELKGQRTKACMITKALDGWYPAKAPYGYMNDKNTKTLARDEYFEPIQKILLDLYAGKTIPEVTDYLNRMGLMIKGSGTGRPRPFKPKDVWKIADKSMFYAGYYNWGEHKQIKGKHESMINWHNHLVIQNKLRHRETQPKIIIIEDDMNDDNFILNFTVRRGMGFIHCDCCGDRMSTAYSKGKMGSLYPYYFCRSSECSAKKKSHLKQDVELQFSNVLQNITPTIKYVEYFKSKVMKKWEERYEALVEQHKIASTKVAQLEQEKKDTIAMRRSKELKFEDYELEMTRIENELAVANLVTSDKVLDKSVLLVKLEMAKLFLTNLEPLYNGFSTANKQRFISLIFPEGVRYADGKFRTLRKSYLFEYLENLHNENWEENINLTPRGIEPRLQD